MPILHFNGYFLFHMPEYNNDARNRKRDFNQQLAKNEVLDICGCDPAHYYEFNFLDTEIAHITYDDRESNTGDDPVKKQKIELSGIMPDVSPSAICAQLFAGQFEIRGFLKGKVQKAMQSDLRLSIRPLGFGDKTVATHFETLIDISSVESQTESKYIEQLGGTRQLELYFHINHYTRVDNKEEPTEKLLTGDVYGYIRPPSSIIDSRGLRIKGRRLVAHPNLRSDTEIGRIFLYSNPLNPSERILLVTDIEGSYDITSNKELLTLRYLDFIPFLDRKYSTPKVVGKYRVYFSSASGERIDIGDFKGDHEEMKHSGGLLVFELPKKLATRDDLALVNRGCQKRFNK